MKTTDVYLQILMMALYIINLSSCDNNAVNNDEREFQRATLTTSGYDFSRASIGSGEMFDGKVTKSMPNEGVNSYFPNNGDYVWWNNTHLDSVNELNQTIDLGIADLSSVSLYDTSNIQWDIQPSIFPLRFDHVFIVQALEGVVKFKILNVDIGDTLQVEVEYFFSASTFAPL